MPPVALSIFLFSLYNAHFWRHFCQASEFNLDGDYLIGGLFPVHYTPYLAQTRRPEAVNCLKKPLLLRGYQALQVMRFAVEEINNSSTLLPNVTLGYQLFDHCTDADNFPAMLQFLSVNGSVKLKQAYNNVLPTIVGFVGAFSSHESKAIAPLLMMDLIPMVTYAASSSSLSDKQKYPSFVRMIPSNTHQITLIIHIIKHFGWNWVAFIGSKSAYSQNGLELFNQLIANTSICLAYHQFLSDMSQLRTTFKNIDNLKINVLVLFIEPYYAENIITSAMELNFHNKVWIASDAWSMNNHLLKLQGMATVGTVIGVTPTVVPLHGFNEFIYRSQSQNRSDSVHSTEGFCNQACENCSSVNPENIINQNPIKSFAIYSAVYTIAMALHNALQCSHSGCNRSRTVYPYMLLEEIKHLELQLNKVHLCFDKNLDTPVYYSIVFWDTKRHPVEIHQIGTYSNYPVFNLTIRDTQLHWHGSGQVPFSNCSVECQPGHIRHQDGQHQCCFTCMECLRSQYANHTADLYSCLKCDKYEWSDVGSASCQKRSMEYLHFSEGYAIVLLASASSFILLCLGVAVLFAIHRSTPVVRSAGGSMCFLMLGSLAASAISIFFFFNEPTPTNCIIRDVAYGFFYTVCLSCLLVRSFQIVCIFKLAAHLPKVHAWLGKHNGQWLVVAGISLFQFLLIAIWMSTSPPLPVEDTHSFKHQVVLVCCSSNVTVSAFCSGFTWVLCGLGLWFNYMGRDLPKDYNEVRCITFCVLFYYLGWASYITVYMVSNSKYVQVVKIGVELSSLYSIMFSYFIPKSFIIVFQPMKNTQEYFQSNIQSYTQTISRM